MLTRDELIELLSNANRNIFLGADLYEKCKRNGNKISKDQLQKRLDFWKNNYEFSHLFKNCNVDDVTRICNFSPDKPVDDILDNKCYNDVNTARTSLEEANNCAICYEYNKNGEFPNKIGCGHYFHYSCLNDWAKRGSNTCPTCRRPINMLLGLPTQTNIELFKTIQSVEKNFITNYMKEMKLFMTKDEINAFKQIFNIEVEDISIKERLFIFLILTFIWSLITKGSAYISTTIDPTYTPFSSREDPDAFSHNNITENIILIPSTLYIGFELLLIALSVFGSVLKRMQDK
jgi:hypothetical protein